MDTDNKTAIFYITDNGLNLAERLKGLYPEAYISKFKPETITGIWEEYRRIIFIMATGIVVRTIAPLIKDKRIDPAVIVLDEKEEYAISLLSGHLGGANKIAREIAGFLGGQAVVTTASDVNNLPAIDLWARENGLIIENWDIIPQVVTRFLNNNTLRIYSEIDIKLSKEFFMVDNPQYADMLITNKKEIGLNVIPVKTGIQKKKTKELDSCFRRNDEKQTIYQFYLRPKNLIVGIGCNSGTSAGEIEDAVKRVLAEKNFSFLSIHSVATIDIKADEKGLNEFVRAYGFSIKTFAADELNSLKGIQKSALVFKTTGAYAVAEPAALLASGSNNVLVPKQKIGNVTVAVAELRSEHRAKNMEQRQKGKLYIVGTGPGGIAHITPYAQNAIRKSDVIVGYSTYLDLIQGLIKDKEIFSTGMTQEIDRCKKAVELAIQGKTVSVISGGDPGIYAMAGLVFEMLRNSNELLVTSNKLKNKKDSEGSSLVTRYSSLVDVEVIPGVSALNACAARLGAPLMHDFACISLSDRLTPWGTIEKRIETASLADFVIVLYNPKSTGRTEHINRARDIILKYRHPETPVGIVRAAMREDEKITITNLKNMLNNDIDMQTTIIIGNSQTFIWNGWMITPRGYERR